MLCGFQLVGIQNQIYILVNCKPNARKIKNIDGILKAVKSQQTMIFEKVNFQRSC